MKLVKIFLSLLLAIPLLVSTNNRAFAVGCTDTPDAPPTTFELGKAYFKTSDSTGNFSSGTYFTNIVVDIDPSAGVPASYVYKGMELAVFNKTTNSYIAYIGSVSQSCMKADLGDAANYASGNYYEVRYRVNYTAMTDPPQEVRSSWRTVPNGGFYFVSDIPSPMSPSTNPQNNYSWVESKTNASYVGNDFSGTINSLVLTDQSSELLSIMSEAWYTTKVERTIQGYAMETFSGNPSYKADFSRDETMPLVEGVNRKDYPIQLALYSKNPTVPDMTQNQTVKLHVLKGIFDNLYDLQVTQAGQNYTVTLTQKPTIAATDKTMLDNSQTMFGVGLNKPYFVVTNQTTPNVEDYTDKLQLTLGTPTTFTFTGTNPLLRIGYIGNNGKKGYTLTYPLQGLLNPRILGITDGQTISTSRSSYGLNFEVRGKSNVFRFPSSTSFNWSEFATEGVRADVFVKKLPTGTVVAADKTTYFSSEPLFTTTGQAQNQLDTVSLTESAQYLVGIRATNKFGEVAYDFKQFYLMLNGDTKFLTVTNNANFEIDENNIRYNGYSSVPHGMTLLVNGLISVKTGFNVAHQVIMLGTDSGTGPVAKIFKTDLTEYTSVDLTSLGMTKIKDVQPYQDGFLVSGIGGSRGMVYIDLNANTITTISGGLGSQIYTVLSDGATIYCADDTNLYAGSLQGTTFKQVSSVPLSSLFGGTAKVRSISKVGDKLFVSPDTNYGSSQVPIAIVSIE